MKKRVYITYSHHHVVREWFRYRGLKPHVLSFDSHTDFNEAFIRVAGNGGLCNSYSRDKHKIFLNKHSPCKDIEAAIADLNNDEHIDFAIRSGIIKRAFVFSFDEYIDYVYKSRILNVHPIRKSNEQTIGNATRVTKLKGFTTTDLKSSPADELDLFYNDIIENPIVSFSVHKHSLWNVNNESQMSKLIVTDEILREVMKAFYRYGFKHDNYILDFDCDFIRDLEAMTQNHCNLLTKLIKGARAITIAREPDFVLECSGQTVTYNDVEEWLIGLIQNSEDGFEIEKEP